MSPVGEDGSVDPHGQFEKPGAAVIYREQAKRLIAVKFSVRGRDLASAVDEARKKTQHLFKPPYRAVWSGEFEEMQDAETRLMWIIPLSLGLIFILLYSALRSWLDAVVVLSNVLAMAMGGVWALCLTGTNFSISAAVGFISLFGVAIMDGLLLISYFNTLRSQGRPLQQAIIEGASKRVRPVMMTDLTALCGLLPAALSTQIGSQTQRPLAIVVVGGMATMLLLTRYLTPVLYSFYGHREPPASGDWPRAWHIDVMTLDHCGDFHAHRSEVVIAIHESPPNPSRGCSEYRHQPAAARPGRPGRMVCLESPEDAPRPWLLWIWRRCAPSSSWSSALPRRARNWPSFWRPAIGPTSKPFPASASRQSTGFVRLKTLVDDDEEIALADRIRDGFRRFLAESRGLPKAPLNHDTRRTIERLNSDLSVQRNAGASEGVARSGRGTEPQERRLQSGHGGPDRHDPRACWQSAGRRREWWPASESPAA